MLPDSAPIDQLPWPKNNLRVRILNALENRKILVGFDQKYEAIWKPAPIKTVGKLRILGTGELSRIVNLGRKSQLQVLAVLALDRARIDLEKDDFGDLWVA